MMMSNSLKERLKKLGRYHRESLSPQNVFNSATVNANTPSGDGTNSTHVTKGPLKGHVVKRQRLMDSFPDNDEDDNGPEKCLVVHTEVTKDVSPVSPVALTTPSNNIQGTLVDLKTLKQSIKEKEEIIRKVKLIKFYKSKHSLQTLDKLIKKWTRVCQLALLELQEALPSPQPSMAELLTHLQLEHNLVKYNCDDENFVD